MSMLHILPSSVVLEMFVAMILGVVVGGVILKYSTIDTFKEEWNGK